MRKYLFLVLFGLSLFSGQAQTEIHGKMLGWDSDPPQFLFYYQELESFSGAKELVDIISIGLDGRFTIETKVSYTHVATFEAPPYAWNLIVEPASGDSIYLNKPKGGPTKLRGVYGSYSFSNSDSHPYTVYSDFSEQLKKLEGLVMYDRMAQSGAIKGGSSLVNKTYLDSVDAVFDSLYFRSMDAVGSSAFYADLIHAKKLQWMRESGEADEKIQSTWRTYNGESREFYEKVSSPGWCSSYVIANGNWFEKSNAGLSSWVSSGRVDSISDYLKCTETDAQIAMWWWDIASPSQMTSGWWARYDGTAVGKMRSLKLNEKLTFNSDSFLDQKWTTPSSDIVSVDELYGKWTVILIVKYGSTLSLREWNALRSVEESIKLNRNDLRFMVLSIDEKEELWNKVLKYRESTGEMVRWVGADTRWLDGFGISSVPQVVVLTPGIEIFEMSAPSPSKGLLMYLENLPE